jgi:CO/xanthine dehydrogenase Mo-binding subunit
MGEEFKFEKGQFAAGMAGAAAKIEATYTTSTELHAAMEPHAIIAQWQGQDSLTVYEPSQWVMGTQRTYAELFGIPSEKVRIVTPSSVVVLARKSSLGRIALSVQRWHVNSNVLLRLSSIDGR